MGGRINYTALGFFVLLLGSGLIYSIYWFSADQDPKRYKTYVIYFSESVSGISEQTPVKYNGVSVGFVSNIQINSQNLREIKVLVDIAEGTPITEDTSATIISRGVTGLAFIGLTTEVAKSRPLQMTKGEAFPIIKSSPSLFVEIDQAVDQVLGHMKMLSTRMGTLLDEDNQMALKHILGNLDKLTTVLAQRDQTIEDSFKNIEKILKKIDEVSLKIPEIIEEFSGTLKSFNKTSSSIEKTSQRFGQTLDEASQMIHHIDLGVVSNLSQSMTRLDQLLIESNRLVSGLQQEPSVLIRGKKLSKLGPGEHNG